MDLEALLKAFGDDHPSGEDLEYESIFIDLEIAATHGEEKQAGDIIIAGDGPDYKDVSAKALEVMAHSHDLRAGIFYAEAQLRLNGLVGFAGATTYIRRCLNDYWDTCYPQLDEDDDNDPTMRVNAVLALSDDLRIVRGVRSAPLTVSRTFGSLSLRDIAVAEGEIIPTSDMESVPDVARVAAAFQDTDVEELRKTASAAATALSDVLAINSKFDVETPGAGPNLDPLIKNLKRINTRLSAASGDPVPEGGDEQVAEGDYEVAPSGGGASSSGGGGINNRNDVLNSLDRIIAYYERNEPTSPAPLLLKRTKNLVNADFLTIMKDMAPGGLESVNLIGGITEEY